MSRRLTALLTTLLVLVPAASAQAGWFPATPVDGPNAFVTKLGNVDLARDGAGAVAYLKVDGDSAQPFVVRMTGGAWRAPERVSYTTPQATEVKVAAGDGNRLAIAWIAAGAVYGSVSDGGGFAPAVQLGGPGAQSLDIDLGVNGAAYAIWEQGGDVRAARLQDQTWTPVAQPLDVDPALPAGIGNLAPRVAVSAEGYAVATWGDARPDGFTRVWARRITGLNLSVAPQDLTIVGGGAADSPDIDIEDDGSFAWVVFRQEVDGVSRTFGRRLIGSLFEAPEAIDGGIWTGRPRVDMSGAGRGHSVSQAQGTFVVGSWLDKDHFQPSVRLAGGDSTVAPEPEVFAADRNDMAAAWRWGGPDGFAIARARYKDAGEAFGGEVTVSRGDLGSVSEAVSIGGDRVGDVAVAMIQQSGAGKTLAIAVFDRPPGSPFIDNSQSYKRKTRPELRWRPGLELWGTQTYRVLVDGAVIGTTSNNRLVPSVRLTTGTHKWQVEAVDQAGQVSKSRLRTMRIDATAPTLKVRVSGKRVAGAALKITVTARDNGGSKLDHITVNYGDRSPTSRSKTTRHRYRRGTFTLKVAAVDKAGNVARKSVRLRIKAS